MIAINWFLSWFFLTDCIRLWNSISVSFFWLAETIDLCGLIMYRRVSIVVLNQFLRVSRKFENNRYTALAQVRILSWDFFPYTFFIHFIKFSSAVEMSSSIQNFSPIKFFLKELFNIFGFWKPFENFFSQVLPI